MGTSRRRFLKSAAAVGGVALGHGTAMGEQRATRSESFSVGPVSPEAQLELHAREHLEANATAARPQSSRTNVFPHRLRSMSGTRRAAIGGAGVRTIRWEP